MINNNSLDQRINEAAKILIDNGWSYLDCIRVLKSATPEINIRGTQTGRSPSTVPTWGGTSPVVIPTTYDETPIRIVRTGITPPYTIAEQASICEASADWDKDVVCSVFSKLD